MTTPERTLDDNLKAAIRGAFHKLRDNLPGFRPRMSQNRMIATVSRALGVAGGRAIAEAPTGTGKSMAYMTPAIPIALAHGRKVVISTATIALQEQVFKRDIPLFLKATGLQVATALAKGRNRYACTAKLIEMTGQQSTQDALFEDLEVATWARPPQPGEAQLVESLATALTKQRWDGDLDNPPSPVPDELKPLLTVAPGACTGRRCPFYRECPAQLARAELKKADVIVSNHDLTLASLKQEMGEGEAPNFLSQPDETLYIFDEGHTLSRVAVDRSAEAAHLPSTIQRTGKLRKLFAAAYRFIGSEKVGRMPLTEAHALIDRYLDAINALHTSIQSEWKPEPTDRDPVWRARMGQLPVHWRDMAKECRQTCFEMFRWLSLAATEVVAQEAKAEVKDKLLKQFGMASEQVEGGLNLWKRWSALEDEAIPVARWLSLGSDKGVVCHASEVSAAPFLREALWSKADSVVITSATLSEGGDFGHLMRQLGAPEDTERVSLPSPFDLEAQATLSIPAFPVLPDSPEHPKAIADWLASNLDWTGGSLVLFTSRWKMLAAADHLPASLRAKVRVQGETSKQVMLKQHAETIGRKEGSVLFGLLSLGEGLDLPGDLVSHVVCTQVPFAVPTDPVGATLSEWVESKGGNSFFDLAVPAATRTLTQFTGRLIRTETDKGVVSILDRRLVKKRYGKTIIDALPPFRRDIVR